MDEALEGFGLKDANILKLLCLPRSLVPIKGCDGPSLAPLKEPNPPDLLPLFEARWSHVVGAYNRQHDDKSLLLVNNASKFIRKYPALGWPTLLARSPEDFIPSWSCCVDLDNAQTTHEQDEEADGVCPSPHNSCEEEPSTTAYDTHAETTDSPASKLSVGDKSTSLSCPYCEGPPFDAIRSFLRHGRRCSKTCDSARAKILSFRPNCCVYDGCSYRSRNYKVHENLPHYICSLCGKIATKYQSQQDCYVTKIDPVEYFVYPPTGLPKLEPNAVFDRVFSTLAPPVAQSLALLDDVKLAFEVRRALKKCQASAVSSLETNSSIGNKVTSDSPVPVSDPSDESAHRIQQSPGRTVEALSNYTTNSRLEQTDLLSGPTDGKTSNNRQLESHSLVGPSGPNNILKPNGEQPGLYPFKDATPTAASDPDISNRELAVTVATPNANDHLGATTTISAASVSISASKNQYIRGKLSLREQAWQRHRGLALSPRPQLQLEMPRTVPDTALSVGFAMDGNIDGLKDLFRQGLASPRDESVTRGYTLLRWALYGGMDQYKTVQFLLLMGARVDEESYEHAFDFALRGKCSTTELAHLSCIRYGRDSDWIEEQNFSLIHKIIFRLDSKSLVAELRDNPKAVHFTDAQGRTALDWATARAQLDDMKLLIDHGSNLNTMDIQGRTTILHAVDSHSDEVVRIVLEAGADPNPRLPKGVLRSSPLTSATFGGLAGAMTLLLKSGAKIDACNPEGRTALHWVARTQNIECAEILLKGGADLDYMSSNKHTPLTTAITDNNHAVLELFGKYITDGRMKGPQLLPIIAEHADVKTMSIASSWSLKLSLDLSGDSVAAGRETLRQRKDYDWKLGFAFEELLSSITKADNGL